MKNTNKKGFTLVELVIVIAVIAILAAVLIPTFTSVITRANQSAVVQKLKAEIDEAYVDYVADEHTVPTKVTVYTKTAGEKTEFVKLVFGDDNGSTEAPETRKVYTLDTEGETTKSVTLDSRYGYVCFSWTPGQGFSIVTATAAPTSTLAESATE